MPQGLLAERFAFQFHRDTKNLTLFWLTVAKSGSKLQKVETAKGLTTDFGRACKYASGQRTMAQFTDFLSQRLERPVVNRTGLEGAYRVTMAWAGDSAPPENDCIPSLTTALQEQLGLSLTAQIRSRGDSCHRPCGPSSDRQLSAETALV
jgi:uncharacterized protein (TIGR03435 family)